MPSNLQRVKHFLGASKRVRNQLKPITNLAQFIQVRNVFAQQEIDLLLDVGANAGQFASEMRAFYKGEMFSFEPVSTAFNQLKMAASGDPKWRCFQLALGSKAGTGTIHVAQETQFSFFLKFGTYCAQTSETKRKRSEKSRFRYAGWTSS